MMKRKTAVFLLGILLAAAAGCNKEKRIKDRSAGDELFRRTVALVERFMVRMENTPDSASVSMLALQFEDSLERLNFSYPPDTDLLLTEGQNDTIHQSLKRLMEIRDERLSTLLRQRLPADTIPSDSVTLEDASHSPGN